MALDEREPLPLEQLVGAGLHVVLDEFRLVVEQVLLRRRARHVQVDDRAGLGGGFRLAERQRVVFDGGGGWFRAAEQAGEGQRAQPDLRLTEEVPPREEPHSLEAELFVD